MRSKYYSYTLIILAYGMLALVSETLIQLEAVAMRSGISSIFESNTFLVLAFLIVFVGHTVLKTIKLAD